MALDPKSFERACLEAYEGSRRSRAMGRALVLALALALLAWLEAWLGWLRAPALLGSALLLLALVYVSSVRGGAAWHGTRLGLRAGVLPLVAGLAAEGMGMTCTPAGCTSWCVPACALAGGAAVAFLLQRGLPLRQPGPQRPAIALDGWFWGSAGLGVIGLGALGCACVSYGGALALAAVVVVLVGSSAALVPPRALA